MPEAKQYVRTDEHGVMRVGQTQVMLDGIVYRFREGESAEGIQRCYRGLTLEEAYGALAYYLANQEEVDAYLRRQEELTERLRAEWEANAPPVVHRLRAMLKERLEARGGT